MKKARTIALMLSLVTILAAASSAHARRGADNPPEPPECQVEDGGVQTQHLGEARELALSSCFRIAPLVGGGLDPRGDRERTRRLRPRRAVMASSLAPAADPTGRS
jgi:hypothetical protein